MAGKTITISVMDAPYESANSTTAMRIINSALEEVGIPLHAGRPFRSMSATHSTVMPATDSGACRPPLTEGI